MRILLVGEYSLIQNSLKEGLIKLGHEVVLIGNSNGFKCYPVDYDYESKWLKKSIFTIPRKIFFRLFKFDLAGLEYGFRFYFFLPKLKNFDIVQFVNEAPIKTTKRLELYLMKQIAKSNNHLFLLSCGIDYMTLKYYTVNQSYKSILQPFFQNQKYQIFQVVEDSFEAYGVYHLVCNGKLIRDNETTVDTYLDKTSDPLGGYHN